MYDDARRSIRVIMSLENEKSNDAKCTTALFLLKHSKLVGFIEIVKRPI